MGTAGFMAPELINKKIYSNQILKIDTYSFGCLIYLLYFYFILFIILRYFKTNVFRGKYKSIIQQNADNDIPIVLQLISNNTPESF